MKLEGKAKIHSGMNRADELMRKYFKDSIELTYYFGPAQMCVFGLEYEHLPSKYKIKIECERGFIQIKVIGKDKKEFSPWMIYPGINYYHYEDRNEDVEQLVSLTFRAIQQKEIVFLSTREITELGISFHDRESL